MPIAQNFLPQSLFPLLFDFIGALRRRRRRRREMRPGASYYPRFEQDTHRPPHFLDSCFLCRKPLSQKSDIYMYRGNTPFCTQECRQEQIATDEANEKRLKLSSSKRASNTVRKNTESEKEFDSNKSVQSNTVAVS